MELPSLSDVPTIISKSYVRHEGYVLKRSRYLHSTRRRFLVLTDDYLVSFVDDLKTTPTEITRVQDISGAVSLDESPCIGNSIHKSNLNSGDFNDRLSTFNPSFSTSAEYEESKNSSIPTNEIKKDTFFTIVGEKFSSTILKYLNRRNLEMRGERKSIQTETNKTNDISDTGKFTTCPQDVIGTFSFSFAVCKEKGRVNTLFKTSSESERIAWLREIGRVMIKTRPNGKQTKEEKDFIEPCDIFHQAQAYESAPKTASTSRIFPQLASNTSHGFPNGFD